MNKQKKNQIGYYKLLLPYIFLDEYKQYKKRTSSATGLYFSLANFPWINDNTIFVIAVSNFISKEHIIFKKKFNIL